MHFSVGSVITMMFEVLIKSDKRALPEGIVLKSCTQCVNMYACTHPHTESTHTHTHTNAHSHIHTKMVYVSDTHVLEMHKVVVLCTKTSVSVVFTQISFTCGVYTSYTLCVLDAILLHILHCYTTSQGCDHGFTSWEFQNNVSVFQNNINFVFYSNIFRFQIKNFI